ncbi:MAG: hypothetical protein QOC92_4205 [Acidimicrobiaceae bacterium]
MHIPAVLDVAGPRNDGRLVVAAHGRLLLMDSAGRTSDFAPEYSVPDGPEPYIALSPGVTVDAAGCSFDRDDVFALDLHDPSPGITKISADGTVSHLADVGGVTTLLGIALDTGGGFGHRLLVIGPTQSGKTQLSAVDCRGTVTTIGAVDTPLEGGIAVAPSTFGRFRGQLIAPDEKSGTIYALSPTGELSTVAAPGAPAGPDIGVESVGFVPAAGADAAFLADRGGQADPHAGTDSLLRLTGDALTTAGVRPGDLLVATEGGATVVQVRCATDCTASVVATGPPTAHTEGRLLVVTGAEFRGSPAGGPSSALPSSASSSSSTSSGGSKGRGPLIVIGIAALAAVGIVVFVRRRGRRVS